MKKRKLKKKILILLLFLLTLSSLIVIGYIKFLEKDHSNIKENIKDKIKP